MVISGGQFKPDALKPKEVVSLLLDDAEMECKFIQKQAEKKADDQKKRRERKRKQPDASQQVSETPFLVTENYKEEICFEILCRVKPFTSGRFYLCTQPQRTSFKKSVDSLQ